MRKFNLKSLILLLVTLTATQFAVAQIVGINGDQTNLTNCNSGNVVCNGSTPFLLSNVLNGTTPLTIPANGTPEFIIEDNLSGPLNSLTLQFAGSLASNASINCQVNGWPSTQGSTTYQSPFGTHNCTVNGLTQQGQFGATTDTIIWSIGSGGTAGLTDGELFDVNTASFAHAGQDHGQLTGVPVPEGGSALIYLVLAGLSCVGAVYFRTGREKSVRPS